MKRDDKNSKIKNILHRLGIVESILNRYFHFRQKTLRRACSRTHSMFVCLLDPLDGEYDIVSIESLQYRGVVRTAKAGSGDDGYGCCWCR